MGHESPTQTDGPDSVIQCRAIEKDEFIARFKKELKRLLPRGAYEGGEKYVDEIVITYWDDLSQRAEGPEECADSEASEWGQE